MGLADLHVHTIFSYDGSASVSSVLARARQVGLDVIAVTDHDEIRGSLRAQELAPRYGLEAIPGIEITTAEGDLLALNITKKVPRDLPLIDTVLRVGELEGFCIPPHPMAGGLGMKSLSATSIAAALRQPDAARILLGIETYNATALDRKGNYRASVLAEKFGIPQTGSSDAHVAAAVGLGATEFAGHTASDLFRAIVEGKTIIYKQAQWTSARILGSWVAGYLGSAFTRFINVTPQWR
jgi:predicted metal-dependent phosphoesterase TrpH